MCRQRTFRTFLLFRLLNQVRFKCFWMGDVLEELETTCFISAIMCGMKDILFFSLLLLLIWDERASFWWIFDEARVLTICWPTMDSETRSLGSNPKDVLLGQCPDLPRKTWSRNSSWLTGWRTAVAELSASAVLCDGLFEIVIKEKRSALVVKAIMRWAVLTLQCRDPRDPPEDPFTAWGKSLQTPCAFCVFYWSFKTNEFALGNTLYVPEPLNPKRLSRRNGLVLNDFFLFLFLFFSSDFHCGPTAKQSIFKFAGSIYIFYLK